MGQPKAFLDWQGQPLWRHVAGVLRNCVDLLIVVGARTTVPPPLDAGIEWVSDRDDFAGPLAGLERGLEALPLSVTSVFLTGCDTPFISTHLIQSLFANRGQFAAIVPVDENDRAHPLCAVYGVEAIRPVVRPLRQEGERRMMRLLSAVSVKWIKPEDFPALGWTAEQLRNLNTPEQYADAMQGSQKSFHQEDLMES